MTLKITVKGIPEVKEFLKTKDKELGIKINRGVTLAGIHLQGEVKESIAGNRDEQMSVDTGRFLNSVGLESYNISAKVFSKLPYADFLEYGTSKFEGRRHFNNSADRNKQRIKDIIKKEVTS